MAALRELGAEYLETAARLRVGLEAARERMEALEGVERQAAGRDVALLEHMLREVREVGDLARHYYEPAYWRNGSYTV